MSRNYNSAPQNDDDGSDGYDGSRDSAGDNVIIATATNKQEISSNIVEEGQGAIAGAVTAVTSVESGNNTTDTQVSLPPTTMTAKQTQPIKSETIHTAGEIYRSGANWYCRQCKLYGDKFYMEVHICKGYVPM